VGVGYLDEAVAGRSLVFDWDGILEIPAKNVALRNEIRDFAPHLWKVRWEEMDDPFRSHRQGPEGLRGANGKGTIKIPGELHGAWIP
jgi:hypothetical protein